VELIIFNKELNELKKKIKMTNNERKQISLLGIIAGIAKDNYFNELSSQFFEIASNGLQSYSKFSSDKEFKKELPKIIKFFTYVDNKIVERNWKSSMVFLLSFVLGISTDLLIYLKDIKKVQVWLQLQELAQKELSVNYSNYLEEIEKADEMLNLIYSFTWD